MVSLFLPSRRAVVDGGGGEGREVSCATLDNEKKAREKTGTFG